MMNILVATSRELAYYSASFFADRMAESFREEGHRVFRLEIAPGAESEISLTEKLHICKEWDVDAVIDINSSMPRLEENGSPWLDRLGALFVNYLLDHPIYHEPGLSVPLARGRVACIDRVHARYVEQHYPWFGKALVLPLAGTRAMAPRDFSDREEAILVPATFDAKAGELSEEYPEFVRRDQKMRNELRLRIVSEVINSDFPVALMGHGWERTALADRKNVTILPPRDMAKAIEAMGRYQYVMDINPLFECGMHDRVPTALANGAVCVTTMNPSFDPGLVDGKNICYYRSGMDFPVRDAASIASAGEEYYQNRYTWRDHVRCLEKMLSDVDIATDAVR